MLGHDMSWASFHVVEAMSLLKYHLKTVGYLAAIQSFGPDTDVLMITSHDKPFEESEASSTYIGPIIDSHTGSNFKSQ